MATRITATEAALGLADLLDRIRDFGESFDIVRNGEIVARLTAATPAARATTLELLARLAATPVDDAFGADLEQIQDAPAALPPDPWRT